MGLKSKFCARCGKETGKLADGICVECRLGGSDIIVPKRAVLVACKSCGSVDFEGIWIKSDEPDETHFENNLIKKIRVPENTELESVKISERNNIFGKIAVTFSFAGRQFTQIFPVQFEKKLVVCPECSMHRRKEYVATIQLRDKPENVRKMMENMRGFETNILKTEGQKRGIDIYFTNKEAAKHAAAEMRKEFNLFMKQSGQAYSWDKQKNRPKYKLVILLRARE